MDALTALQMHTDPIQPYPIPAIGGYTVPGNRFVKWQEMLHVNNYEEGKIFGMSKRRREQFPAIVSVVQSLVEGQSFHVTNRWDHQAL